jgi:SAM-dependent methyltransferase
LHHGADQLSSLPVELYPAIVNRTVTIPHHESAVPSQWVRRWASLIAPGGRVLDVACGGGRHARYLAQLGHPVDAVDRDAEALATLTGIEGVAIRAADLENGQWPYASVQFAGIVVANYLHRPLFPRLIDALAVGGVLIYETFAAGNERYGRPRNPDFLLQPGELLEVVRGQLKVIAYEDVFTELPKSAMVQRICAVNGAVTGDWVSNRLQGGQKS